MELEEPRRTPTTRRLGVGPPGHDRACNFPLHAAAWGSICDALQLTERELEIIQAIFEGQKEDDIAACLGISRYTVHTHVGRLYRKLQVDSCSGLLLRVFREYVRLGEPAIPVPLLRRG